VKQVLPSDSSLLDLVFPHGGRKEADLADDDGDEGDEDEGGDGSGSHEAIMQQILAAAAASEEAQADEEEIARAMLREFDERLKGATLRRAQEKRRRLSLMMKQYSTDPSSPFRALFLPSSPLSTSGTTIPVRLQPQDRNDIDDQQQQKSSPEATHRNDDDDVHASETAGGLVIPSGRADHGETRPDAGLGGKCQQEPPRQDLLVAREEERDDDNDEEGLPLEDVDLNTPRHERRAAAAAPHDDGGDGGALAEHHQQEEEQAPVAAHAPTQVEQDGNTAAAGHEDDELEQQEPGDHH
jgi:hypothetical protein